MGGKGVLQRVTLCIKVVLVAVSAGYLKTDQ